MNRPKTMLQKIWDFHIVDRDPSGRDLIYIDMHLLHEVTSPQAFEALRLAGRKVRVPGLCIATMDHSVPTAGRMEPWADPLAVRQIEALSENCRENEILLFGLDDTRQGVIHVMAPEQGLVQPGMIVVCGDSHTATHGALGALTFGIGTSEVEHVLATQTLALRCPRSMSVVMEGTPGDCVTAKDIVLSLIRKIGVNGGAGHSIEFRGKAISNLSVEGRLTVCNMAIEAGARSGTVSPDETTFNYLRERPFAPKGDKWDQAIERWKKLASDDGAVFDKTVNLDVTAVAPLVTWGTTPEQSVEVTGEVPALPENDLARRVQIGRVLQYMGLNPGERMSGLKADWVFIGSCTNGRIEDLRAAASILKGRKISKWTRTLVVPGSGLVKAQAEEEGLARVFVDAGCEWRDPGCSMCLGMNPDVAGPGDRVVSTSNRNFEGRQGRGARTHLVSPLTAAASAITGRITDPREFVK